MFRITEDPSLGSLVQCLAKNCKHGSVMTIHMDKVSVMAAYSDRLCSCVVHCIYSEVPTHTHTHTYTQQHILTCFVCVRVCVVHCIYSELHTQHILTCFVCVCV